MRQILDSGQIKVTSQPSFEQIVRDHQQMVFRTLLRLVGRRDVIDDLAQDVFLRLFRALPSFRGDALVSTYLYRIIVNVAHNEWKRRERIDRRQISLSQPHRGADGGPGWCWEDRLEHPALNPQLQLEDGDFRQRVEAHLLRLSPAERSVLVLYHQEERSYEQIAESLRMPVGTVRTHLHRGRKKLREALAADLAEGHSSRSARQQEVTP